MTIFTKKAFFFTNRETNEEVTTKPLAFNEVPEWVVNDPLFDWAKEAGELVETKKDADASAVEKKVRKKAQEPTEEPAQA